MSEPILFAYGALVGALAVICVICVAIGLWYLLRTEAGDADSA